MSKCTGCEAKPPTMQGEPVDPDGAGGYAQKLPRATRKVYYSFRTSISPGDDDPTPVFTISPERIEVVPVNGSCAEGETGCAQATSCAFTFRLILDVYYSLGFLSDDIVSPDTLTPPTLIAPSPSPWSEATTVTQEPNVEFVQGLFPDSYDVRFEATYEITRWPGCGVNDPIVISWATNFTPQAQGGSGSLGSWVLDPDRSRNLDDEIEFGLECAPCARATPVSKGPADGKNARPPLA